MLGLPPLLCFLIAIKPLFDKAYNYTDFYCCGIAEHPLGALHHGNDLICERGCNARALKIARFTIVFLANVIIVASMIVLIKHVVSREQRMNENAAQASNESSIKATWQGLFYSGAFIASWGPWYVSRELTVLSLC